MEVGDPNKPDFAVANVKLVDGITTNRLDDRLQIMRGLDRFRRDMGGLVEAYQEVARRLGIMNENEPPRPTGPVLVASSEPPKGMKH